MDGKTRPMYMLPLGDLLQLQRKYRLKVKQWDDAAIIMSDKVDFKPKKVTRENDRHYILIKRGLSISKI